MPKTGATRYQKFLKSERGKTKLKNNKELPKGTNVTKTNFKVKKIILKEQLKKHGDEALSTKKQSVKDLLPRLSHFNVKSRTEALNGLKEIITAHPDEIILHNGNLIKALCPLLLNVEKSIRMEALNILHIQMSNLTQEKINPFFHILSTYLRSAMTNIDSRIQEDSLSFLDSLLTCFPKLVIEDFYLIMPDFLNTISKLTVDSKPGRTLTVNLGSHITSVKWRTLVLSRLHNLLDKFVEYHNIDNRKKPKPQPTTKFDYTKSNYFPLNNPICWSVCELPVLSYSHKRHSLSHLEEVEQFNEYIKTLLSLLFDTWVEACPREVKPKNGTVINKDVVFILKHVLKVIFLLCHIVEYLVKETCDTDFKKSFCQSYKQLFTKHIFSSFPYSTFKQKSIKDPNLITENLEICQIFIKLNPMINLNKQSNEIHHILNYVESSIEFCSEENCEAIVKMLNIIFSNTSSWTRTKNLLEPLIKKIIWAYLNINISDLVFTENLFLVLGTIYLNDNLAQYHDIPEYKLWLEKFPDILLRKSITTQTVGIIFQFSIQKTEKFNEVMRSKMMGVIENLPKIVISNPDDEIQDFHKLLSTFYWIKCWDSEVLNLIERQLLDNVYKEDYGSYLFDKLKFRAKETEKEKELKKVSKDVDLL